jgi:hypothetical protein
MGHLLPGDELGAVFKFFNEYYCHLKNEGVSFVVAGDQRGLEQYFPEPNQRKERYLNLHSATQAAAGIHFSDPPWNAECIRSENLYWWTTSNLAKVGNGLAGESWEETRRFIRDHLYNGYWVKELMHPAAEAFSLNGAHRELLALFHTFFGGPCIVSDLPSLQDGKLLSKMILPGGKVAVADRCPELLASNVCSDPLLDEALCVAETECRGRRVVGAFHVSETALSLTAHFPMDEKVGLWSGTKGWIGTFESGEIFSLTLSQKMGDLITFFSASTGFFVIGTPTLFLPHATVEKVELAEEGATFSLDVRGPVVVYTTFKVMEVKRDGKMVPWDYDPKRSLLMIEPTLDLTAHPSSYQLTFDL